MRNQVSALLIGLSLCASPALSYGQEVGAKVGDKIEAGVRDKTDSITVVQPTPESKYFIWAPRLKSNNWHAGIAITNWKDDFDREHEEWPGRRGDEIVTIGNAAVVIDKEPVRIDKLTASGSLIVKQPLTLFEGRVESAELTAEITIKDSLNLSGKSKWIGRSVTADGSRRNPSLGELVNRRGGSFALDYTAQGGAKSLRLRKAFWNSGTVDQGSGALALVNGGTKSVRLFNDRRAKFYLAPGASITTPTPKTVRIHNSGTFAKAAAASNDRDVEIVPPFVQDGGKLVVGSGKIILKNGGEFSGGTISGSGVLEFAGGTTKIASAIKASSPLGLALSGGRLFIADGGSLTVSGEGDGFHINGGTIHAEGPLDMKSNWRWSSGDITGSGGLTSRKTLTIDGAKSRRLTGPFTNIGTVVQGVDTALSLEAKSTTTNLGTYRLDGALTGTKTSEFINEGDVLLGRGAKVTLEGGFSNTGEVALSKNASMQLKGGLKELVQHFGNLPLANPKLPGDALVLQGGNWTIQDGASVDIAGPQGFTKILAINEDAIVTLSGSGRINNMPQPTNQTAKGFLNFGILVLKDKAKWTSGGLRQLGILFIDKTSSMIVESSAMDGEASFSNTGTLTVDGTLTVTNQWGTAPDDNRILMGGQLTGAGTINGKPVSAFGGTVTKAHD